MRVKAFEIYVDSEHEGEDEYDADGPVLKVVTPNTVPKPPRRLFADVDEEEPDTPVARSHWDNDVASVRANPRLDDDYVFLSTPVRTPKRSPIVASIVQDIEFSIESISLSEIAGGGTPGPAPGQTPSSSSSDPVSDVTPTPLSPIFSTHRGGEAFDEFVSPSFPPRSGLHLFSPTMAVAQPRMRDRAPPVVLVGTPRGRRRLNLGKPGRVVVDNSSVITQILAQSTVTTFTVNSDGETPLMGGGNPQVKVKRDGAVVCAFKQPFIRDGTSRIENMSTTDVEMKPFYEWTDVEMRMRHLIPLGIFTVKSAYFVGTRKDDLIEKRECGLVYSRDDALVTVVQSTHPDHVNTVNHFVILLRGPGKQAPLVQVAIHKRVWAHSWVKGREDVYFPRVPVDGSHDVGLRIFSSVYASKHGPRDPKTGRALEARVVVSKIVFELPPTSHPVLATVAATKKPLGTAPTRRGIKFDE